MKKLLFLITCCFILTGCVQKAYKQTVIYTLKVPVQEEIKSVGIRGNDQPLSWDQDTELKKINNSDLYQTKVTFITGYKFTEVKFTVNGKYELQNMPNRRVEFKNSGVTHYNAVFNEP
ncbi:hypothetical protein [Chryseobacterium takakiae]|uniref:Uncharacterized protein n=1 Tax=Chryseobacterium takakiae TaxID=1302685 RepID=A0A1M4XPI2_9FLAO|nr:hypothetical protein [Chryseobacterium takakiae]SHE95321.1 hypothetical protein SAMN05444408_106172 [Chryseobacterium takakiae]